LELRLFKGFAIKDAHNWNNEINSMYPNDIRSETQVSSFSMNIWYFNHKDFKMAALKGKTGHYNRSVHTWYIKNTFNIFGVTNQKSPVIPSTLSESGKDQTEAYFYSATDFGIVPGYAYVNRIKNWQFAFMGGFGGVFQAKFYGGTGTTRGFLGLAPRYDVRLFGGYSASNYFIFLLTDFDNKSIRFGHLIYKQQFYNIKVVLGKRISTGKKKKATLSET
jgi:hypothetical protein